MTNEQRKEVVKKMMFVCIETDSVTREQQLDEAYDLYEQFTRGETRNMDRDFTNLLTRTRQKVTEILNY